jgi:hypothetical protein
MKPCEVQSVAVLDRAGMSASLACAVHCAVLPLVLAALPAYGEEIALPLEKTRAAHNHSGDTEAHSRFRISHDGKKSFMPSFFDHTGYEGLEENRDARLADCWWHPGDTLRAAKSPGPRRPAGGLETYEKTCPDDL